MEFRTHRKLLGPFKIPVFPVYRAILLFSKERVKVTSGSVCKICNIDTQTGK